VVRKKGRKTLRLESGGGEGKGPTWGGRGGEKSGRSDQKVEEKDCISVHFSAFARKRRKRKKSQAHSLLLDDERGRKQIIHFQSART